MSTAFFTTVSPAFSLVDRHYYDVIFDVDRLFHLRPQTVKSVQISVQSDASAAVYKK